MIKRVYLLFVFLFISGIVFSQQITIKGTVMGGEGKEIVVYDCSDQITLTQTKMASGKIDTSGYFEVSFNADYTFYALLKVEYNQVPIYLEPAKVYNLSITCPQCNSPEDKTNPYLAPKALITVIENQDSTELNYLINRFDLLTDEFLFNNYISLLKQRNKTKLDSFKTAINKIFSYSQHDYFKNLLTYRLASIEHYTRLNTNEGFIKNYIWNKPVLYNNTGYMELFNGIFSFYATNGPKYIKYDLAKSINVESSFPALLDSLGKDSLLRNEVIREMVAIKLLGENYYSQLYNQTSILKMLKYVQDSSKFEMHKKIAQNYIRHITKLISGSKAPAFKLKDYTGTYYSLNELNQEKYVYLLFFTTWCVPCISEMNLLGQLKEKFGTKVEFVAISTDKEFMTFYYFMQKNELLYNFTILHWGNNATLLDDYNVKTVPTYILIDPEGKIVQAAAEPPSEQLDELLYKLTKGK